MPESRAIQGFISTPNAKRFLIDAELGGIALHPRLPGEPGRRENFQAIGHHPRALTEIVAAVGATQANISKHLALLAAAAS